MSGLAIKKYIRRFISPQNGLSYSTNEWRVLRGPHLVQRFARRRDALAFVEAHRAAATRSTLKQEDAT